MHDKHKVIVGSLVGAIVIHAAFVACGHIASVPETGEAGADGNTDGTADAGDEPGLLDALVEAIATLIDGTTKDAVAGVDGGAGGSDSGACGCAVSLSGPVATTPASENTAQLASGTLTSLSSAGSIAVTGPFVLTDATTTPSGAGLSNSTWGASLVVQPSAASCTALCQRRSVARVSDLGLQLWRGNEHGHSRGPVPHPRRSDALRVRPGWEWEHRRSSSVGRVCALPVTIAKEQREPVDAGRELEALAQLLRENRIDRAGARLESDAAARARRRSGGDRPASRRVLRAAAEIGRGPEQSA
jgi:hypothetical protein